MAIGVLSDPNGLFVHTHGIIELISYPHFTNIRFLDQILSAMIPLCCGLYFIVHKRQFKMIIALALTCGLYLAILCASRSLVIETVAIIIFGVVFFRQIFLPYLMLMFTCFCIALMAFFVIDMISPLSPYHGLSRAGGFFSYQDRWPLILLGFHLLKGAPFFEQGLGCIRFMLIWTHMCL